MATKFQKTLLMLSIALFVALMLFVINIQPLTILAISSGGESPIINDPDLLAQIESAKTIIMGLAVSFLGTGTFGLILNVVLKKLLANVQQKVAVAEQENKINTETAQKLYTTIAQFQKDTVSAVATLTANLQETNVNVKALMDEYKARDEKIAGILQSTLGAGTDEPQ